MKLLLSVVMPTYNERDNIALVLEQLTQRLQPLAGRYEILVVDDQSPDGTAEIVQQDSNSAVRLLQRTGRRDLSASLAAGFDSAAGAYVVAMDADLQHDPGAVMRMLHCAQQSQADVVIATRYAEGGAVQGWSCWRHCLSQCATRWVRHRLAQPVSDPLSGFFLLRRSVWQQLRARLHPSGFKLLLDILHTDPALHCVETGYRFVARTHGSSKLDIRAVWAFACTAWQLARSTR